MQITGEVAKTASRTAALGDLTVRGLRLPRFRRNSFPSAEKRVGRRYANDANWEISDKLRRSYGRRNVPRKRGVRGARITGPRDDRRDPQMGITGGLDVGRVGIKTHRYRPMGQEYAPSGA